MEDKKNVYTARKRYTAKQKLMFVGVALVVLALTTVAGWQMVKINDQKHVEGIQRLQPVTATPDPSTTRSEEAEIQRKRLEELIAINEDGIGWITVPNTNINFPVLQTDNNSYYLKHDLYHKSTIYGVPFVDYECDVENGAHTIIYGHTMGRISTEMFSQLQGYDNPDYLKDHPTFQLDTIYKSKTYKVVAAYIVTDDMDSSDFFSFNASEYINFSTREDWQEYLNEIKRRAIYTVDDFLVPGQEFVSLCTCYKIPSDLRIIVVGRPLQEGESLQANDIWINPSPLTPAK